MASREIHGWDDLIDTREVLSRIDDLVSSNSDDEGDELAREDWNQDELGEWRLLTELIDEVRGSSDEDPIHGVTLVSERYFAEYIKDLVMEGGGEYYEFSEKTYRHERVLNSVLFERSPFTHIDWEAVADEYSTDYTEINFDGFTFYYQ